MSTLLAAAPTATAPATSADSPITWPQLFVGLACVGLPAIASVVAAYFLGAWRRNVQGPPRVAPGQALWPVLVALCAALVGLFAGAGTVALFIASVDGREILEEALRPPSAVEAGVGDPARRVVINLQISAGSYLFATSAALLTMAIAQMAGWKGGLAVSLRRMPRGTWWGLLAVLVVIPCMLTASVLLQMVLKALDFKLETMHEIIRAIRDHPQTDLIAWGLFSAVVVAPLAEEILFRGVLQTALVHGWARLLGPAPEGRGFEVLTEPAPAEIDGMSPTRQRTPVSLQGETTAPGLDVGVLPYAPAGSAPAQALRYPPSAPARWFGIVLTSILFAALHEPWSIPLILLLSLALGYLYERTGNLWTSITVHFCFNAFNMLLIVPLVLG
jgi:membrane protease YdiL (CAAX protease family)